MALENTASYVNDGGSLTLGQGLTLSNSASFIMNGGILNTGSVDLRLHDASTFAMESGTVDAPIISFDESGGAGVGSSGIFNLSGGAVTITTSQFYGIFSSSSANPYVNFTDGSTGQMLFTNIDNADEDISDGLIRYNGNEVPDDGSVFNVTHPNGGTQTLITLVSVVPEPQTWAMILCGAGVLCGARRMRRRNG
jgi:hypothetical protein